MENTVKNPIRHAVLIAAALTALPVLAEDIGPEPEYTIAFNIGMVSDYRVRGLSQTSYSPALQGGIDFTHKSGLYVGTFASNVKWIKDYNGGTKGSYELDLYGGFRDSITSNLAYDVGIITYQYPGNNSGKDGTPGAGLFTNASFTEAYINLNYKIFNLKYNRSLGTFVGDLESSGSQYFDLNAAFDLGNGFTLVPHIGHQMIPNQGAGGNQGNYTDYSLSLSKDLGSGFTGTITAMATTTAKGPGTYYHDFNGRDIGRSVVLVGVKYNF